MFKARVITLFPEAFPSVLGVSLAGKALQKGIWSLDTIDLRSFGEGKHQVVDDTPAGGGAGMVLRPDVVAQAVDTTRQNHENLPVLALSPRGRPFTQSHARTLAEGAGVILLCGRFEGIDERVLENRPITEVSVGDYIVAGGESAALVVLDAIIRLLPDVVGKQASLQQESFEAGLLEHPHYTRPALWEGKAIPEVLTSGNHEKVAQWRQQQAETLTKKRRPDLWQRHLQQKDKK